MTEKANPSVTFAESSKIKAVRVGEHIEQYLRSALEQVRLQLRLGDVNGKCPTGPAETEAYGFLLGPTSSDNWWRNLWDAPNVIVAKLWFKDSYRQASHKKWVIEVFGKGWYPTFCSLGVELNKKFGVDIHVRLESEKEELEHKSGM